MERIYNLIALHLMTSTKQLHVETFLVIFTSVAENDHRE